MTNKDIARVLKQTADLIVLSGGNTFRARAFETGARRIDRLDDSAALLLREGELTSIDGIGAGLAAQIAEVIERGSFELRDDLLSALPPGLLDLLRVNGLGAKRVRQLWQELDITTLDDLEAAATTGRLTDLGGFGTKMQEKLLASVKQLRQYQKHRRYADALNLAEPVLAHLRSHPTILQAELSGPLRRCMETVDGLDLIAATESPRETAAHLETLLHGLSTTEDDSHLLAQGALDEGFLVRIALVTPGRFGTVWWLLTGSDAHSDAFRATYGTPDFYADEAQVYAQADLAFVPPELREGDDELDAARENRLPRLITVEDLYGNLHNHSNYSDGTDTLREMADAARKLGYSYFGICDHSQSLQIANGMPVARVREQQAEIERLNSAYASDGGAPFRIFSGIESDILADGSLDYDDEVLASFDFVVASVHSKFNMTEAEATERLLTAIQNPYTTILGHPTGRLLLAREGYPIDHEAVIAACAKHHVALELNANPYRLDVDWRWIRTATAQGVRIAINPDAHATAQLAYTRWGVAAARKGWLTADQCLNALDLDAFADWLRTRRENR